MMKRKYDDDIMENYKKVIEIEREVEEVKKVGKDMERLEEVIKYYVGGKERVRVKVRSRYK